MEPLAVKTETVAAMFEASTRTFWRRIAPELKALGVLQHGKGKAARWDVETVKAAWQVMRQPKD